MTPIPETKTIHRDPRAAGVTPDASAEYTSGIMSKLKFIFDIAFIADAGNIGAAFGRIAETNPIAPITKTLATAEADAMSTDVIASVMMMY
jgi:hypothetical protein